MKTKNKPIGILKDIYSNELKKYYNNLHIKITDSPSNYDIGFIQKLDNFCIFNKRKYEQLQYFSRKNIKIAPYIPYYVYPCLIVPFYEKVKYHLSILLNSIFISRKPLKSIYFYQKIALKSKKSNFNLKRSELNKLNQQNKKVIFIYPICLSTNSFIISSQKELLKENINVINIINITKDYFEIIDFINNYTNIINKVIIFSVTTCPINNDINRFIIKNIKNNYYEIKADTENFQNDIEIYQYYLLKEINND